MVDSSNKVQDDPLLTDRLNANEEKLTNDKSSAVICFTVLSPKTKLHHQD
ncbi:hypothetical protein IFVP182_C1180015 [Vibrio parahaemolyticus]